MSSTGNLRSKEVKVRPCTSDFYFTILYDLKNGLRPSRIAKKYKMSKQAIHWYTEKLKQNNLIKKVAYGVWEINEKEVKEHLKVGNATPYKTFTSSCGDFSKQIRGHGFSFKVRIPKLRNWENREKYLTEKIKFKNIGLHNSIQSITIKKYKIWLCKKSIIVYAPKSKSYFTNTAKESKLQAIADLKYILNKLEGFLKVSMQINGKYVFKVSRQHYAKINDELAEHYNRNKNKLAIEGYDGQWFLIDNSFNLNEAECVHPAKAQEDMDEVIHPFLNQLRETKLMPNQIIGNFNNINNTLDRFSNEAVNPLTAQIKLHLDVMHEIKDGIKLWNQNLEKLNRRLHKQ